MAQLSSKQYDALEGAITAGRRIAVRRRGATEVVVLPTRLRLVHGREQIEARHPTTGDRMELWVDEIVGFEVVR